MRPFQDACASRTKILVVDDQPANLLSVRAILEPLDQEILEARSGNDALRQLLASDVSVVLLDIQMPGLDGFEVAKLIRSREKERLTPIIFLTAFADHRFTIAEAYELGAIDYLEKPLVPAILVAKVAFFVELYQKAEMLKRFGHDEQQKTQDSESRKTAILETAIDCIVTIDASSRIVEFNPAAEATFGYRKSEVIGRSMPELLIPPRLRGQHFSSLARYVATGEGSFVGKRLESVAMRAGGAEFPIELSMMPHGQPQSLLFTAYLRDITDRKRAEEKIQRAILREQEQARELRRADQRKDEFLAMLAHELRNPLAAATNALRIARSPGVDHDTLAWSQDIMERQLGQLSRLIDDLLDISRITRGKIKLRKESVRLERLVERAADAARPQFDAKAQSLTIRLPESEPLWVDADPARIEQILGNLLINASKYTPDGGEVDVTTEKRQSHAIVRVRDNGIGIAPHLLPHMFQPFAQADNSLDRASGGLGIGLTLVKALAEMHGGSARAFSEGKDKGAEFTLSLPVAEPNTVDSKADQPAPPAVRRNILLVDDNADGANTLALVLKSYGHTVHVAGNGADGLMAVQRNAPEVVLLDIGLPEMDGFEVARRLRHLPGGDSILLIAITGYGQDGDRKRSRDAGFDHHLVKPVNLIELLQLCQTSAEQSECLVGQC